MTELGVPYVVGIVPTILMWALAAAHDGWTSR